MTFKIMGRSKSGTEEIDTAETRGEAHRLLGEYRLAFGAGWDLWIEESEKPGG